MSKEDTMTKELEEARARLEDAIDCSGAAREDDEIVVVTAGDIRRLLDEQGNRPMTKTLANQTRTIARTSGTLAPYAVETLLKAASRIEELERALKVADHDLTTTHNLRATDLSPDQMNEALNRGVALSDLEWMTDNSRGLDAISQALSDKG
jgi:hypothetical protein